MFDSVNEKLKASEYFLDKLKELEKQSGNLASAHPLVRRYQLDGFLFEIIAAKDLFLQEINKLVGQPLKNWQVSETRLLEKLNDTKYIKAIEVIKKLKEDEKSWLWRLNAYRNVTAHKAIMGQHIKATLVEGHWRNNQGLLWFIKSRIYKSNENKNSVSIHLAEDPNDPSKGAYDEEIILYCENSLKQMKVFLDQLYKDIQ